MNVGFNSVSVRVPSKLEELEIARVALNSLAAANHVSASSVARLQIVLDELASNIISHSTTDTGTPIEMRMQLENNLFTLSLTDDGPDFDPTRDPFPDAKDRPRIGGRGLDMVRALTDSMTHKRAGGRNHTIITKSVISSDEGKQTMIPGITLDEQRIAGAATVALVGRIDSGNAGPLTDHLSEMVKAGHARMTLDMARLEYLTSAGFRTLLIVSDAAEEAEGALILANLTEEVRELFDLSGLSRAFEIQ